MKKRKLLELLTAIPGNPEIHLWNGFVSDWTNIGEIQKIALFKMTKEYYTQSVKSEEYTYNGRVVISNEEIEQIGKMYNKVCKWVCNEFVTEKDIAEKRYHRKYVFVVDAKTKNQTYFDRLGIASY